VQTSIVWTFGRPAQSPSPDPVAGGHVVNAERPAPPQFPPDLRQFLDTVVVPALVARWLQEHTTGKAA
jgi:hypothetical protein